MAHVHSSVNEMSRLYLTNDKRYNYTTPKSFLELINLYIKILSEKHSEFQGKIERLNSGLDKLKSTGVMVEELKAQLALQEVELGLVMTFVQIALNKSSDINFNEQQEE